MSNSNPNYQASYGVNQPIVFGAPSPIVAKRAPQTSDISYPIGILWVEPSANSAWVLTSIVSNSATWILLESSGGSGVFASLTVTPGPISLTGTTSINTSGAAVTTINTGGTGATNIGNATGNTAVTGSLTASTGLVATAGGITATGTSNINTSGAAVTSINTGGTGALNLGNATGNTAVTGSLTASTTLTATAGNITATAGNFVASTAGDGVVLGGGAKIVCGTGDPNTAVTAPQGSLYLRLDGSSASTRAYINSNSGTTWIAVTTAS